jgi:hypothetical protein
MLFLDWNQEPSSEDMFVFYGNLPSSNMLLSSPSRAHLLRHMLTSDWFSTFTDMRKITWKEHGTEGEGGEGCIFDTFARGFEGNGVRSKTPPRRTSASRSGTSIVGKFIHRLVF